MEKLRPAKQALSLLHGADLGDGEVRFGMLAGGSSSNLPRFCGLVSNWRIVSQSLGGGMVTWEMEGKWVTLFHFNFINSNATPYTEE